jgi:TolB protein
MSEIPGEFPLPADACHRQRSLLREYAEMGRGASRPRSRGVLVAVAAAILVGGLLVAPGLGLGSRLLDVIQGKPPPRDIREPSWSRDGRKILYVSRGDRNTWDLYVINVDGSGQRMLASVSSASAAWSPDGRKIAFRGPGGPPPRRNDRIWRGLFVINADGSGKRRLAWKGEDPAWSPDGRTIAFAASSRLYVVNADGTGQRRLAGNTVAGSTTGGRMSSPAWSPDGGKIAFLSDAGTSCDLCFHLYVVNADGSGERRLTHFATPPRTVQDPPSFGTASFAWSPEGRRIAFALGSGPGPVVKRSVWIMNADGREQRKLTQEKETSAGRYARVAWSPDGRKLVFTNERDGNRDVYVINPDGGQLRRLTDNPEYDGDAAWSPDGGKIAFVSDRDGDSEVYVMDGDGSGQRKLTHLGG